MRGFRSDTEDRPTVIVVGEGLIGAAVSARLRRRRWGSETFQPTDWSDPRSVGSGIASVVEPLEADAPLEIVWSAGTTGMDDSGAGLADALDDFAAQTGSALDAAEGRPVRLHHLSSAGALGPPSGRSRFAVGDTPYAARKSGEEDIVSRTGVGRIHRVSSVFGTPERARRSGVIGLMVDNALKARETQLFARTTTMRNYLHASDVAEALVRSFTTPGLDPILLAANRSHPMSEVVAQVSHVVRRPVPIAYRPPANAHDMVFDPREASPLLPQRSLVSGIRLVHDAILTR